MTEQSIISRELEKAREKLLDLTARNRLLNIPPRPSTKSIVVDDELSTEVFAMLVRQGKKFSFLEADGDAEGTVEGEQFELLPQPDEQEDEDLDERGEMPLIFGP